MPALLATLRESRGWWFDLSICCTGLLLFAAEIVAAVDARTVPVLMCIGGVVLTVVVSRYPMVVDRGDGGGIEVGFDSSILMFLLCTLDTPDALVVWSLGVVATQLTTGKRLSSKLFNIGVGIIAGGLAAVVLDAARGTGLGTPRELAAVALAAAAYFATDFVLSAISVAISTATPLRRHLLQRETLLSIACLVPFDTLGYLGAVVHRATPWWTLSLLAVPLVTLLVATRAITRGQENARRLQVLFDAAVRAQTLSDRTQVEECLVDDARRLLRLQQVSVRPTPPTRGEIGVPVQRGHSPTWLVAKALDRARSTVTADEQALQALAAVAYDAFARLKLTEEMVHFARHDPLTDLPNRGILLDRVTSALRHASRDGGLVALLFIDLDGFKPVNDRFGHAAGDAVLVELASRLRSCVRATDTVSRLGGDEFAVLFEDAADIDVAAVSSRLLAAIRDELEVAGHRMSLSASAGVAFGVTGDSAAGLVRKADLAMYVSKAAGHGQVVTYDDAIGQSRIERLEMVDELRRAVAAGEIDVAYQPIVSADSRRIVGAEALARWQRNGVAVPPDVFIKAAEEAGLIVALGDVVLAKVAADSASLGGAVDGDFVMTVNISPRQLQQPAFVGSVERAVATMGGIGLVLEITEREGIEVDPEMLGAMHAICATGARFAVDDFGVGFSSISYLHDLPVHFIKADGSLSQAIDTDERASALLRSVMLMGRTLGLGVVVEGIEREEQLTVLRGDTEGIFAQGYLLHRPMPREQLMRVVAEEHPTPAPRGQLAAPA